jgi:capsular exopolysaccharide synthesis family protein
MVLIGVGVGLALALPQDKTYSAEAIVLFQDPNQDLSLTGTASGLFRTAQQQAQIGADTIITPRLARSVKRLVRTKLSAAQIKDNLSASADPASSQVFLDADAPTARLAADLANAAATVGARFQARAQRTRYATAARRLQGRAQALGNTAADLNQHVIYNEQITRLRTLSTLAQPVQVSKQATIPTSPTSPKPIRNGILGGIAGLLLGLALAAVRETVSNRLSSIGEVEDELELPVLAHVGEEAMGRAGLSQSGLGALPTPEIEAFRILRTNLRVQNLDHQPRSILVTSPMPEEGKSTVAASLAFSYAMGGRRTILVECDFRRPSLAQRLGLPSAPGLIDHLLGRASLEEAIQHVPDAPGVSSNGADRSAIASSGPLEAIVAGDPPEGQPAELFETPAYAEVLDRLGQMYDVVIIDTPPLLPVADTIELLPHVDTVLFCVRASKTTRSQALAGKSALEPVESRLAGVVVTGVSKRERGDYGYYGYYAYRHKGSESGSGTNGDGPDTSSAFADRLKRPFSLRRG